MDYRRQQKWNFPERDCDRNDSVFSRTTRLDLEISDTQWNWIVTRHHRDRNGRHEI